MFAMTGKLTAQPGERDRLAALLLDAAKLMEASDGCLMYLVATAVDDPDAVWVTELWASEADHEESLEIEGVRPLIASAMPLFASAPEPVRLHPLGGKGMPGAAG